MRVLEWVEHILRIISIRDECWVLRVSDDCQTNSNSTTTPPPPSAPTSGVFSLHHGPLGRNGFWAYRTLVAGLCIIYDLCRNCSILCLQQAWFKGTAASSPTCPHSAHSYQGSRTQDLAAARTSALKPFKIYVKCICKIRQSYEWLNRFLCHLNCTVSPFGINYIGFAFNKIFISIQVTHIFFHPCFSFKELTLYNCFLI